MTMAKNMSPDDLFAMADRLRSLRVRTGLSQQKFSKQMGLGYGQWANFESARGRIGLDAALTLNKKMGISLDWIYRGV